MYVDANGQVHDGTEPESFNPLEQGYRLSGGGDGETLEQRFERAADNAASFARGELEVTVPTALKVAAGVVGVGIVALPVGAAILWFLAARKAAQAAAAAAPYIAEAGPVIMAVAPEAAPVVAAAGVVNAVNKARAGQPLPADTGHHVSQRVGSLRTTQREPSVTIPGAPASNLPARVPVDEHAPTERDPSRGYAGQLLGALRTIAPQPSLRVEVDGVPVRAELMQPKEHDR